MSAATATKPLIMTLSASGTAHIGMRSETAIRDFGPVTMDEPPALGGDDTGPNPMEYVLASLIGCASVMIRLIARELDFSYNGARFELSGELDLRGLMGEPGVSPHFSNVTGRVLVDSPESPDRLAEMTRRVESRCPVFNMLRDAGTRVDVSWESA